MRLASKHFPRYGDKVNDCRRGEHVNGFIRAVSYVDGPDEVIVRFDDGLVYYEFTEFEHTWTDAYQGCFILSQPSKAAEATAEYRWEKNFLHELKHLMEKK